MKSIKVTQLRKGLINYMEQVTETGEPILVTSHGTSTVGIVPTEWAQLLEQVMQFDECGTDRKAVTHDLKNIFGHMLTELSSTSRRPLIELVTSLIQEAAVVQKYHNMKEPLSVPKTK